MATQLATAYVPIVPTVAGLQGQLAQQVLNPALQTGDKAGRGMGGRIKSGTLGAMKGMFAGAAGLLGVGVLASQVGKAITNAGNLEQSVGAIDAVFKANSGTMHKWSKDAARDVGLSRNEFNELGTLIGAQLKNGGTAMEELAPKTKDLIGLGADLSSMFGGTSREAVEALSSALKGERDPIERYGVTLNQAKVDAEAAALGFEKVGGSLSQEANQAATLSLIMKQTADAHGNFARESDTYAHKVQVLGATWDDLRTKAGTLFIPVLTKVVGFMGDRLLPALENSARWIGNVRDTLAQVGNGKVFTGDVVKAMGLSPDGPLGGAIKELIGGVQAFAGAWRSNTGDITSSGFAGYMERFGYIARQTFDYVSGTAIPALAGIGATVRDDVLPAVGRFGGWLVEHRAIIGTVVAVVGGFAAGWLAVAGTVAGVGAVIAGVSKGLFLARTAVVAVQSAMVTARIAVMLFNGALLANPIGLVVGALVALGVGLTIAYHKSETFRTIVDGALNGVKAAAAGVVRWWTGSFVPGLKSGIDAVGRGFTWLRDNVVRPVFKGVATIIAVNAAIWLTVFDGVKWALRKLGDGFVWLYDHAIKPAFDWASAKVEAVRVYLSARFALVRAQLGLLGAKFVELYDRYVRPKFDAINAKVEAGRAWIAGRVADVRGQLGRTGAKFAELYDRYVRPKFDAIMSLVERGRAWISTKFADIRATVGRLGAKFAELYDRYVRPKWDALTGKLRDGWEWVKRVALNPMRDWVTKTIPDAFTRGVNAIGRAWDKLKAKASSPVEFVIDKVINGAFIKHFNNIIGKFDEKLKIDPIRWNGFREGGRTGGSSPDEVRGVVHGREFVLNEQRTRELDRLAPGFLDRFHKHGAAGLPRDAQHAPGASVYGGPRSFIGPLQHAIYGTGVMNVVGSAPGYDLNGAVAMMDRATRVKVQRSNRMTRNAVHVGLESTPDWWAGYYSNHAVRLNTRTSGGMHPMSKRTMLAHELGHALGLPHSARMHGGNGVASIMNYDTMYRHQSVTPADVAALSRIYGGTGFASGGGSTADDGGGLIARLADRLKSMLGIDKLIERIPDAGLMTEILGGAVRKIWDGIKSYISKLNPFGGGEAGAQAGRAGAITSKLYDGGGLLEYSAQPQLVMHKSKRPDYVLPEQLFRDMHEAARSSRTDDRGKLAEQLIVQGYTADEVAEAIERRDKQRRALVRR